MAQERAFEISFIYTVTVDEEKLLKRYSSGVTDEDREGARQLFRVVMERSEVANFLMVREIAWHLADIGEREQMPEVLTGYDIEDDSPALAALEGLPVEKRRAYSGGDGTYIADLIQDTLEVHLDHVHVTQLVQHQEHTEDVAAPVSFLVPLKQRHHKQKPRKR